MNFLSPVVTLLGRNASFYLEVASAALLGVVGEVASPLVSFITALWRSLFLSIRFWFYKVHSNTLNICWRWLLSWVWFRQLLEGSAPFLTVLLSFNVSDFFWRGFRSGQKIFSIDSAETGISVPSDLFRDLRSGLWIFKCFTACLVALLYGGSWLSQIYPWFLGFSEFIGRTDLRLQVTSQ